MRPPPMGAGFQSQPVFYFPNQLASAAQGGGGGFIPTQHLAACKLLQTTKLQLAGQHLACSPPPLLPVQGMPFPQSQGGVGK